MLGILRFARRLAHKEGGSWTKLVSRRTTRDNPNPRRGPPDLSRSVPERSFETPTYYNVFQ